MGDPPSRRQADDGELRRDPIDERSYAIDERSYAVTRSMNAAMR
jgi:hypothetical protein